MEYNIICNDEWKRVVEPVAETAFQLVNYRGIEVARWVYYLRRADTRNDKSGVSRLDHILTNAPVHADDLRDMFVEHDAVKIVLIRHYLERTRQMVQPSVRTKLEADPRYVNMWTSFLEDQAFQWNQYLEENRLPRFTSEQLQIVFNYVDGVYQRSILDDFYWVACIVFARMFKAIVATGFSATTDMVYLCDQGLQLGGVDMKEEITQVKKLTEFFHSHVEFDRVPDFTKRMAAELLNLWMKESGGLTAVTDNIVADYEWLERHHRRPVKGIPRTARHRDVNYIQILLMFTTLPWHVLRTHGATLCLHTWNLSDSIAIRTLNVKKPKRYRKRTKVDPEGEPSSAFDAFVPQMDSVTFQLWDDFLLDCIPITLGEVDVFDGGGSPVSPSPVVRPCLPAESIPVLDAVTL